MRHAAKRVMLMVLAALLAAPVLAGPTLAQGMMERKGADFSADEVHVSGGKQTLTKVYMSGNKMRRESHGMVMIARLDKKVAWMIDPTQKSYFETSLDPKKFPMLAQAQETGKDKAERKELGREEVSGFDCVKYQTTMDVGGPPPGMPAGMPPEMAAKMQKPRKMVSTVWISDKLGAALKTVTDDGFAMEMTNIKVGPQEEALFEPPAGYQKMELPPMVQQMMGGGGAPGQMPPGMGKGQMPPGMGKGQMPPGMGGAKGQMPPGMGRGQMPPGSGQ